MVLEPVVSPRAGRMLNLAGAALSLIAFLLSMEVTSAVPVFAVAPPLALGFGTRAVGLTHAIRRGRKAMPWAPRILSWILLGTGALLAGLSGSAWILAAFAAFVVLDFAAGRSQHEPTPKTQQAPRARKPFPYRRVFLALAALGYAGLVVAFQVLYARYLSQGVLITWTLIALGFAVALRLWLGGARAGEAWLRAPNDHRRHERRVAQVADPKRATAEDVLAAFRARGDAAPFLAFVRASALAAELPEADVRALESRILSSFARAGTNRDADMRAALDEIERILTLQRPVETAR